MRPNLAIRLLLAAAAVLVVGMSATTAGAEVSCTKFASTSGSDSTGDGAFANPYATPQKLVDSLAAGQTGCFRGGTYAFSSLRVRSANITITGYGPQSVTLRGPIDVPPAGAGSTIEGMTLDGVNSHGGSLKIYADDVMLRGDEITNEHTGICIGVGRYYSDPPPRHVLIERNRIHDCGERPRTNHQHGIYLAESRGAVVRDNWIYDNADRGIQLYPDAQGSTITGNVIYGNGQGQNFSCDSSTCSKDNVVEGNIIAGSVAGWNVYGHSEGATPDGSNVLRDNCLYATYSGYTRHGGDDSNSRFFSESGNLIAKPAFADPLHGDFKLPAGNACLAKYTGTKSLPGTGTGGGTGEAPANTTPPTVSGVAQQGRRLSSSKGTWSGSPTSYSRRWLRCDASGANCTSIPGASIWSYNLVAADIGSSIRATVTATNSHGSSSVTSPPSAMVAAATRTVVNVRRTSARTRAKANGAVSIKSLSASKSIASLRGMVELRLYRRSHGHWHAASGVRGAKLTPRGRFSKRLHAFRHHRLHAGIYRVQARYSGSRSASPSASRSPTFKLRA